MPLLDALVDVLEALAEEGAAAALLGGLAVSAWTEPRFTRDVDLAVAVDSDAAAERLLRALGQRGYRLIPESGPPETSPPRERVPCGM